MILNKAEELEITSSRPTQTWATLTWVSKRFGALNPDSIDRSNSQDGIRTGQLGESHDGATEAGSGALSFSAPRNGTRTYG